MAKLDKYLWLVNKKEENHFDPRRMSEFEFDAVMTTDGRSYIEKETLKAFLSARKELREKYKIDLYLESAGRTVAQQEATYNEISERRGKSYADSVVAKPGESEHHTGLAIDVHPHLSVVAASREKVENAIYSDTIVPEKKLFPMSAIEKRAEGYRILRLYKTMYKVFLKHGFVQRYQAGDEKNTDYPAEAWHMRYVGKENAREMDELDMGLESFIAVKKKEAERGE